MVLESSIASKIDTDISLGGLSFCVCHCVEIEYEGAVESFRGWIDVYYRSEESNLPLPTIYFPDTAVLSNKLRLYCQIQYSLLESISQCRKIIQKFF